MCSQRPTLLPRLRLGVDPVPLLDPDGPLQGKRTGDGGCDPLVVEEVILDDVAIDFLKGKDEGRL